MITIQEFITKHNITMTSEPTNTNPFLPGLRYHWTVKVKFNNHYRSFIFSKGNNQDPVLTDVLDCLANDSRTYDQMSLDEFVDEFEYDKPSEGIKIYNAMKRGYKKLESLFGEVIFTELLEQVESL